MVISPEGDRPRWVSWLIGERVFSSGEMRSEWVGGDWGVGLRGRPKRGVLCDIAAARAWLH